MFIAVTWNRLDNCSFWCTWSWNPSHVVCLLRIYFQIPIYTATLLQMNLKYYVAWLCLHFAYTGPISFDSRPENHDWFYVGSGKKQKKNKNKNKWQKKNHEWVPHRMWTIFFSTIDYYESFRFSFHLHIAFWSTEDHISNETFQSVIHSKWMGKKAYEILVSDNSISILLRSSAVQHV